MSLIQKSEINSFLENLLNENTTVRTQQISSLELNLANLKSRSEKLLDNQLDGLVSDELYRKKKEQLDFQQRDYEEKITALKEENSEITGGVKLFLELAQNLYLAYLGGDYQKKTLIAKNLFSNLTLKAGKLDISTNFPYNLFEDTPNVRYCAKIQDTLRTILPMRSNEYIAKMIHSSALTGELQTLTGYLAKEWQKTKIVPKKKKPFNFN